MSQQVRELSIERVHLGVASKEEVEAVLADPVAVARLEELAEDDGMFHALYDSSDQIDAIRRKLHVRQTADAWAARKRWAGGLTAVLVPAVAALAVVALQPDAEVVEPEPLENRAKGLRPSLVVHRQVGDSEEILAAGAVATEGDVLQLAYVPGDATHGVVVSIDGNGSVTLHHPASIGGDTRLQRGGEARLPHGYQLDDAPSFERFFLVTDDQPVSVQGVLDAVEALADADRAQAGTPAVGQARVDDFLVRKGAR